MATDSRQPAMPDIARTALSEAGRSDLAFLVMSNGNGRVIVEWSGMRHAPSLDDVRVVHTALRRAYEACAPGEIGEEPGQFTDDAECWYHAILGELNGMSQASRSANAQTGVLCRAITRSSG